MKTIIKYATTCLAVASTSPAVALESLNDADLAGIHARDGLTLGWSGNPSIERVAWHEDAATVLAGTGNALQVNGIQLGSVGDNGINAGSGPAKWTFSVDAGSQAGIPRLQLASQWERQRLSIDSIRINGSAESFGALALDSAGSITFANDNDIINSTGNAGFLAIEIVGADLFWRNGSGEIVLDGLDLQMASSALSIGISGGQGLTIQTASLDTEMNIEALRWRDGSSSPFTIQPGDRSMGGLSTSATFSVDMAISGGGLYDGNGNSVPGQGLTLHTLDISTIGTGNEVGWINRSNGHALTLSNPSLALSIRNMTLDIVGSSLALEIPTFDLSLHSGDITLSPGESLGELYLDMSMSGNADVRPGGDTSLGDQGITSSMAMILADMDIMYRDSAANGTTFSVNNINGTFASDIHINANESLAISLANLDANFAFPSVNIGSQTSLGSMAVDGISGSLTLSISPM